MLMQQGRDILRGLGLKVTPKRLEVIRCLGEVPSFLAAEELWHRLRQRSTAIGLPTVYRILDELAAAGVVTRIFMPDRRQYYFLCTNREHHHHFVCESCHRVEELGRCGLEEQISELARRCGARVTSHIVQINGICAACAANQETCHDH